MNRTGLLFTSSRHIVKPKVYIETSVVSYLTARPSRDLIVAANQQSTTDWWKERKSSFDVFISSLVEEEASGGDPDAAERRLKALRNENLITAEFGDRPLTNP